MDSDWNKNKKKIKEKYNLKMLFFDSKYTTGKITKKQYCSSHPKLESLT